mgnify:FL=1
MKFPIVFRLFNPAGGGAVPIPSNSPYHQMQPNCMIPGQVQNTGGTNPTGIPPQLLMAAAMQQDRPLPPSFGSATQPEPLNPLFRKDPETVTKSPSVSPIQCSSPQTSNE